MTSFVRNQWYVAAWDNEVDRNPLARTICGEPVMLYRKFDRSVVAMRDACPHRLLQDFGVAVVHGGAYGPGGEGTLRVSFASGGAALARGLQLLREGLQSL